MSRTRNSKQRGLRNIDNKLYQSLLSWDFVDDMWHSRNKNRINSRLVRKRLKMRLKKELNADQ